MQKSISLIGVATWLVLVAVAVPAEQNRAEHSSAHRSPYADEADRKIKSLSVDDIRELERGGGWGLARAAELNGVPGPIHLLDLSTELGLNDKQIGAIRSIYESMRASAVTEGRKLIALEADLDQGFKSGRIDKSQMVALVDQIGQTRAALRAIHLAAHLETPAILSRQQLNAYSTLRGYRDDGVDPCKNIPAEHNPAMWRLHNGCPPAQ